AAVPGYRRRSGSGTGPTIWYTCWAVPRPRGTNPSSHHPISRGAVTIDRLVEQELVVHAFAPTDGPAAAQAYARISAIWSRARDLLGLTDPVAGTGLPAALPPDPGTARTEQALAAQQDRAGDHQMIVRRIQDVLNLSMVFATPSVAPGRR